MKAEFVSRAKLSEQAERYDDMAEYMRKVTESGLGKFLFDYSGMPFRNVALSNVIDIANSYLENVIGGRRFRAIFHWYY